MKTFLYRTLPKDYQGEIYLWDVDKTYLNTEFESIWGLLKIFFEASIDKKSIPGTTELLLELRRGVETEIGIHPIYFISASPVWLKKILEGKFLVDGVQHDGITLKDYVRFWKFYRVLPLKNNFAYKLLSLLVHRQLMPKGATETLFGDDFEYDAHVYSLYADMIEGKMDLNHLEETLKTQGVKNILRKAILKEARKFLTENDFSKQPIVNHIFIYMIRHTDLHVFKQFPRVIPTRNYIQTAAILYEKKRISKKGFQRVANAFELRYPKNQWSLNSSLLELEDRGLISQATSSDLRFWK
ncbi:MAG: hypothetical protein A3B70_02500 [Deltaproteobacteria bacterium RIFCSPHIGHO2_02_FULL_40_11]|nr:MAG: hypothetical protein A3B70_02500 [Deltaproteobacteria bacterium RIFCSPHIGHO2_02_FULL_40_11]